ncbi:MAG TPA: Gfo/Idh/MocA family oxidoreductase [Chitinophagaceae bacterium]|nr:Gfo/Idh/MocA family oxidoreductase [Chitinophagaceae bacterium]
MHRRNFLQQSGSLLAGTLVADSILALSPAEKLRVAMVGTGHRGINMWGKPVMKEFADKVQFVGLCDINPGRVETARSALGVTCPTFTDFDKMMRETKPQKLLVMTVDGTHHQFITKGMEYGADIITEKTNDH